ncbi:MAG: D-glycerate dehydrogenase, partial [Rhodobacteraceae bacterium]|nr:D-glycerate dehydrogenase [Paracoccaceae bacterium]
MTRPRLLITRPLPEPVLDAARAICDVIVSPDNEGLDLDDSGLALLGYDAILATLGDTFTAAAFASVPEPRCKLLANFGVGYNHIDVDAARKKGIIVTNTPGAVTDATADIAVMLMLMTARRAGEGERMVRAGQWAGWNPTQLLGTHV